MAYPKDRIFLVREDPQDNRILECAVEGKADFIISGDNHLLNKKEFNGIRIVNAKEFIER
jgi:predicted nucleic acid-binding protein